MVTQITRGIQISVLTDFEGTYYKNHKLHFAFRYHITIKNYSKDSVQLLARHWEVIDALNQVEIIDGEGVVGKKPIIKPSDSYQYSSGTLLCSSFGAMQGFFSMINFTTAKSFEVAIPKFCLSVPFALN
jgi:ApaG protein